MDEDQRRWYEDFIAQIEDQLCLPLLSDSRFINAQTIVTRFRNAAQRLLARGLGYSQGFEEAHNELCVAHLVLHEPVPPPAETLEYEPNLPSCDQRIDFRVIVEGWAHPLFIEVKTIHPELTSRWEQFGWVLENDLLPPDVHVVLDEEWLGGEIWHARVASRSRMLEHSVQLEQRIENCLADIPHSISLAFCGDGSRWHEDELQDFAAYYRHCRHRLDDPLARMEDHFVAENSIELSRSIDHFSYVQRPSTAVLPRPVTWSVRSPDAPWGWAGL